MHPLASSHPACVPRHAPENGLPAVQTVYKPDTPADQRPRKVGDVPSSRIPYSYPTNTGHLPPYFIRRFSPRCSPCCAHQVRSSKPAARSKRSAAPRVAQSHASGAPRLDAWVERSVHPSSPDPDLVVASALIRGPTSPVSPGPHRTMPCLLGDEETAAMQEEDEEEEEDPSTSVPVRPTEHLHSGGSSQITVTV